MKKRTMVIGGIVLTLLVLSKSGVFDALMIFLLVGAVPGTALSVPSGLMLTACVAALLITTFRYTAISFLDALDLRRLTRKHVAYRERMPKKRFGQITHPQA